MKIHTKRIAAQSGAAFQIKAGELLRITDPQGAQVCDLIAFARADKRHVLSSGRTIDYANNIYLKTGDTLYSNRSVPFFKIERDDVERHDFILTPCSPETFALLYTDADSDHPSCFMNLVENLAEFGIEPDDIPTTFNIFMNVRIAPDGELSIERPYSKAGDCIELRALSDLIVGLTACSAEKSNDGSFGPIDYAVLDGEIPQETSVDSAGNQRRK